MCRSDVGCFKSTGRTHLGYLPPRTSLQPKGVASIELVRTPFLLGPRAGIEPALELLVAPADRKLTPYPKATVEIVRRGCFLFPVGGTQLTDLGERRNRSYGGRKTCTLNTGVIESRSLTASLRREVQHSLPVKNEIMRREDCVNLGDILLHG